MKKIVVLFSILFCFGSFFLQPIRVYSEPTLQEKIDKLEREKKEQEAIQEELKKTEQQQKALIAQYKEQKVGITEELTRIEKEVSNLQFEIDQMLVKQSDMKNAYIFTEQDICLLQESIQLKEAQMDSLINALYKDYCSRYVKYLFTSSNINEILDKGVYLKYLYETDKNFFEELKEEKALIAEKKEQSVEEQIADKDIQMKLEKKQKDLENLRSQKDQEIRNISHLSSESEQIVEKSVRAYEQSEAEVQRIIKEQIKLENQKRFKKTDMGTLIWPIDGPVSSEFGMRMHPIFGVYRMHTGIDIDQGYGYPIKSVEEGWVVFSGWLTGYGNCVMIQHTAKHTSLYAHMNKRFVSKDQHVEQGHVIGEVGSTGWSTGPHLHFEIRVNGDYVNPRDYLP